MESNEKFATYKEFGKMLREGVLVNFSWVGGWLLDKSALPCDPLVIFSGWFVPWICPF